MRLDRLLGDRGRRSGLLACAGHAADEGRDGIDAVLREAEAGAEPALAAIDDVGRWLGIGLAGLVNILNPRLVILGGPNARLLPLVARASRPSSTRYALPASRAHVRVVPADARHRRTPARGGRDGLRSPALRPGGLVRPPRPRGPPGERLMSGAPRSHSTGGVRRRDIAATGMKGVCLDDVAYAPEAALSSDAVDCIVTGGGQQRMNIRRLRPLAAAVTAVLVGACSTSGARARRQRGVGRRRRQRLHRRHVVEQLQGRALGQVG